MESSRQGTRTRNTVSINEAREEALQGDGQTAENVKNENGLPPAAEPNRTESAQHEEDMNSMNFTGQKWRSRSIGS